MSRLQKVLILCLVAATVAASGALAKPNSVEFIPAAKGQIYTDLGGGLNVTPDVVPSWGNVAGREYRAYFSFDTSSMNSLHFPAITKVEFLYGSGQVLVQEPVPPVFSADLYVGDFMADGLDSGDWDAGTYAATQDWTYIENTWIDLGKAAAQMFYVFEEGHIQFLAPESLGVTIRNGNNAEFLARTRHCSLRVTYDRGVRVFDSASSKSLPIEDSTLGAMKALFR